MQLTVTYTRQDLHEATVPVRDKRHSRVAALVMFHHHLIDVLPGSNLSA